MQTGDGLLARLRIAGGRISPAKLARLAQLAGDFGNGVVEITARGNLQVRGLTAAGALPFARAVEALVSIERGLVVETPPLAGEELGADADPRKLATPIRAAAAPLAANLGPKVTVVVDGNGRFNLSGLKADIRLAAVADGWALTVGGHFFGVTAQPEQAALSALKLLAASGPEARATDLPHMALLACLGHLCADAAEPVGQSAPPLGHIETSSRSIIGLALPFGAVAWDRLAHLALVAPHHGVSEFRLSPQHILLAMDGEPSLLEDLEPDDFVSHPLDPRRRVSACIGSGGCASGHVAARLVASRLAPLVGEHDTLHVAGCAKGCALPRRAAVTLVGQLDGFGLVLDGRASDAPVTVLRADQLAGVLGPAWRE